MICYKEKSCFSSASQVDLYWGGNIIRHRNRTTNKRSNNGDSDVCVLRRDGETSFNVSDLRAAIVNFSLSVSRLWWSTAPTWRSRTSRGSGPPRAPSGRDTPPAPATLLSWKPACRLRRRLLNSPNSSMSELQCFNVWSLCFIYRYYESSLPKQELDDLEVNVSPLSQILPCLWCFQSALGKSSWN